jgi:hypothetical protein
LQEVVAVLETSAVEAAQVDLEHLLAHLEEERLLNPS